MVSRSFSSGQWHSAGQLLTYFGRKSRLAMPERRQLSRCRQPAARHRWIAVELRGKRGHITIDDDVVQIGRCQCRGQGVDNRPLFGRQRQFSTAQRFGLWLSSDNGRVLDVWRRQVREQADVEFRFARRAAIAEQDVAIAKRIARIQPPATSVKPFNHSRQRSAGGGVIDAADKQDRCARREICRSQARALSTVSASGMAAMFSPYAAL